MRGSAVFPLAPGAALPGELTLESGGRVPDYLQAIAAAQPDGLEKAAKLTRTVIFGGTLSPGLKLSMGLAIATQLGTRYAQAHLRRLLSSVPPPPEGREATALAVRYAENLTRDVHGVSDDDFAKTGAVFNDAKLVELTMTTCFFNYFCRLTEGLGVTPESWLSTSRPSVPAPTENPYGAARIALASDDEMKMGSSLLERAKSASTSSLGIAIANSQRAMMRVPDFQDAWMGGWTAARPGGAPPNPNAVPRTTLLQVSLAVSLVNGCRYCTLHQVQGLRRQGVEIGKLLALQKDDSVLTREEKAAVDFARKLTANPSGVTEADRQALAAAFPGPKAFEVLQQTCRFAFMNRFTDGLRLPSEDEAVKTYRETYGKDFTNKKGQKI
ncbi:MAG: carboxymuconolactone decarboxylase family protein [Armatimonas sp.]